MNRYFPENIVARIAYEPLSAGDIHKRLERLDRETDRLVDIVKGAIVLVLASGPVMDPATFTDWATMMGLNMDTDLVMITDSVAGSDSVTVRDSATVTGRATVTGSALGPDLSTGAGPASGTELSTAL